MTRVKRGTISIKRRKNILKHTKGFRNARKNKERQANQALMSAWRHAFAHRRDKKNDFRRLWQVRISASARANGMSYSSLMGKLKARGIGLDRKILADIAVRDSEAFARIVKSLS